VFYCRKCNVDSQDEESVKSFVQTKHFRLDFSSASINFPVLLGRDEISREIGFEGELPTSILVTRNAREVKIIRGPLKAKELSGVIRRLLRQDAQRIENAPSITLPSGLTAGGMTAGKMLGLPIP
jgi:hypothetical protein